MIQLPNRLAALIDKVQRGESVTEDDVRRTALLQDLDMAMVGRQFVEEIGRREEEQTALFKQAMGEP